MELHIIKSKKVLNFIKRISQISKIDFIEQPLPARLNHEMIYLKGKCGVEFIADESITYDEDLSKLSLYFDGVNIKLMKSGTIRNAKKQLEKAKKLGLKTMLGCMIETSLGISFAYSLAKDVDYLDLDGFILIEDEPFQLLNEDKGLISLKV